MAILGAHMSIAGGYFKAVEAAHRCGCDCVQLFTKNNNQWRAKEITDDDAMRFRTALEELRISHPIAHDSYLINLASPDRQLWKKSVDALVDELLRAEQLGIPYVVVHPGAYTTSSEAAGLKRIVRCSTSCIGRPAAWQPGVCSKRPPGRARVSAGGSSTWPISLPVCATQTGWESVSTRVTSLRPAIRWPREKQYKATMREFNATVGVGTDQGFHLNDSKTPLGSRVDRHAKIGGGRMGLRPFKWLLADRRFRRIPMYLETPKGTEEGEELDVINLRTLRAMIPRQPRRAARKVPSR